MRFNAKELAAVAAQPSYKFEREGVLQLKERQEGLFRRNDVYTERWCRLRGNLLFYYKSKDQCSEPSGVIVLEQCTVMHGLQSDILFCFSLVFGNEEQTIHLATSSEVERDAWMLAIQNASYECVRLQIHTLRSKLNSKQRESDPGIYSHARNGDTKHLEAVVGLKDPYQNEPFLELSLACDNLKCDADGQPPNPLVSVLINQPSHSAWNRFAQTEVIERSSNPCFLTTVGFLKSEVSVATRVKLCIYDVRERVTSTRSLLGESVFTLGTLIQTPSCFLRLTILSPGCESVGFVTVIARELEPESSTIDKEKNGVQDKFWPPADRPRSYSLPTSLPCRVNTPLHAQLRVIFDNLVSQTYRFHTGLGAELRVHEIMAESKLSFSFPQLLLNLWINEEKRLMETVIQLGELSSEWHNKQLVAIERHLHLINTYTQALDSLAAHQAPYFKPSPLKGDHSLEFIPVNMHLQREWVQNTTSRKTAVFDVVTVGAFTAFPHRYLQGGLYRLLNQLKNAYPTLSKDGQPSILGPDRLSTASQSIICVEQLKEDIEAELQHLVHLAELKNGNLMQTVVNKISSKAKQLTMLCNPSLVEEALMIWENAKCCHEHMHNKTATGQGPLMNLGKSFDMHDCQLHRMKSASLPRQFSLPLENSSHYPSDKGILGSASSSDDSDDSSPEGSPQLDRVGKNYSPEDCASFNGSIKSMDVSAIKTKIPKSDSMYSTDESKFSNLSEEFEPLDLTHLNIRASIMCMGSKVQNLANQDVQKQNPEEKSEVSTSEATTPTDLPPWVSELMPSIRKLRQAMGCLQKVAKLTYSLLSLKEPPHSASLSHSVRYRRDVGFSHALTALVTGLMAKIWCQQPDLYFFHNLITAGVLAEFIGLLSCYGDEMGMLEDMVIAIEDLKRVMFWLEPATNVNSPQPRVEGNRVFLSVIIPAPDSVMSILPPEHSQGCRFTVIPVFFNIGINEQATLAEKFGDLGLQERINQEGVNHLKEHYRRLQRCPFTKEDRQRLRGIVTQEVPVQDLLDQLQSQVKSRKSKNVEILHLSTQICRRLHGLRFTSCKSAKDRTSMSVTLEQAHILVQEFNLDEKEVPRAVACMRSEGTRRENACKNVGVRKYAFNSLQLMALPKQYRPPAGTFGNVQS